MGIFSDEKPYTAVTNWVEQLCSEQYDEDDYTGVPDLCDVARLQSTGYHPFLPLCPTKHMSWIKLMGMYVLDRLKPQERYARN